MLIELLSIVISIVMMLLNLYVWVMIIGIAMSWLIAFGVMNPENAGVRKLYQFFQSVTEPVLEPIRRYIPPLGGIDVSPIVVIIGVHIIQMIVLRLFTGPIYSFGI